MPQLTTQELEQTAEAYEELLVPALFEECAHRLLDAAEVEPGQRVLDVACGTGIVARTAAERLGGRGSVTGIDLNPGMLAVARRIEPEIDWREGSVDELPFDDASFDVVLCQFGLMFFPSPEHALRQMWRVLRDGGRMAVATFDSLDNQPAYGPLADVYGRVISETAGEAGRGPFTMGEKDALRSLFARAGIRDTAITSYQPMVRYASVRDLVLGDVEGWFGFVQIHPDQETIDEVVRHAEGVLERFVRPDGSVEAPSPAHIVMAVKS